MHKISRPVSFRGRLKSVSKFRVCVYNPDIQTYMYLHRAHFGDGKNNVFPVRLSCILCRRPMVLYIADRSNNAVLKW